MYFIICFDKRFFIFNFLNYITPECKICFLDKKNKISKKWIFIYLISTIIFLARTTKALAMPKTTEDTILFSWVVALTAIIRITATSTWIQDSDGTTRTFPGGTDEYDINVAKLGTGKKKNGSQSITIRKKLPVCPITGLPIPLKTGLVFKEGFALNNHIVRFYKHHAYNLNPGYYCEIGKSDHFIFYAVVKITDGRKMDTSTYDALSTTLSSDIADLIKGQLEDMTKTSYDFKMIANPIIPGKPYSRTGLRKLLDDGILERLDKKSWASATFTFMILVSDKVK